MARKPPEQPGFAGFDHLLQLADEASQQLRDARVSGHLPGEMEAAVKLHRLQIKRFDAAIRALNLAEAQRIKDEATLMAAKVNGGTTMGILAPDGPGDILGRRCAARAGKVPLWGQQGRFRIEVGGCTVLIAMEGMFGIGSAMCAMPGFAAHAVERDKPFISSTGYRSFLGARVALLPNMTPADFATLVVQQEIDGMRGKLVKIGQAYHRPAPP